MLGILYDKYHDLYYRLVMLPTFLIMTFIFEYSK